MKNIFTYAILLFGLMSVASSCVNDTSIVNEGEEGTDRQLMLQMKVPGIDPASRSIGESQENTITGVDVLAFRINGTSETFEYWTVGSPTAGNNSGAAMQTFSVTLRDEAYQQRFVVITNAHAEVDALVGSSNWQGTAKNTLLAALEHRLPAGSDHWNADSATSFTAMPMWGESAAETITPTTSQLSRTIDLMRMTARIDVALDTNITGLTGKFKLKSVHLYNTNTGGLIAPSPAAVASEQRNGSTYLYVTAPSIPAALQPYSARHRGPVSYSDFTSPGIPDVAMTGAIYTFEVAKSTVEAEAPCLVIGGLYESETTQTYYRLDLVGADGTTRLDILRNSRYAVNIVDVLGSGHPTVEEAFSSKAVNIAANILRWNENGLDNIVFDGTNTLSVNHDRFSLTREARTATSTDNILTVFTDFPSGWTVEKIVGATTGNAVNWLSLSPASGSTGVRTNASIICSQNTTGATRSAIIWLVAGRLRFPVRVDQSTIAHISLDLVDSNGLPVTELIFNSDGTPNTANNFTVKWLPTDGTVQIVSTPVAATAFPSTDSSCPTTGTLSDPSGTHTYIITPPAFTAEELADDPFLVKASKVDFSITNGVETITKSITLRQIHYNILISSPQPYYPENGTQNSLTVKSNTGWRISSVTHSSHSGADLIASGSGTNIMVGGTNDLLHFTSVNAPGNWGTVDFTITSTDTPKRFADLTTELVFAAAPLSVYGFATVDITNIGRNNNSGRDAYTLLTTAGNYGSTAASKVILESTTVAGTNASALTADHVNTMVANKVDVLVIAYQTTVASDVATKLNNDFLEAGGTLIMCMEHQSSIQNIMNAVYGSGTVSNSVFNNGSGNAPVYQMNNSNNPILNGPFGDVRNGYWGNDGDGYTVGLTGLPSTAVALSNATNQSGSTSGTNPTAAVTSFYDSTARVAYFGDGGFVRSEHPTDEADSPLIIDPTTKLPLTKSYGGGNTKHPVSNAALFANAVAWGVSNRR